MCCTAARLMWRPHCPQKGLGCLRVCKGRGKCLLLHAVTVALIKDLHIYIYFSLTYYFTLTVTLSIHGNINMQVLTSNERMSATTIFSLYFNLDKNVTRPSMWVWHTEKTSKSLFMLYFGFQQSTEYTSMHIFTSLDLKSGFFQGHTNFCQTYITYCFTGISFCDSIIMLVRMCENQTLPRVETVKKIT